MTAVARLIACVCLLALTTNANAAPASQPTVDELLKKPVPELNFKAIGFGDAIEFCRDLTGVNVLTDTAALKSAGVTAKTPVTLNVRDVPFQAVLDKICASVSKPDAKLAAGVVGSRAVITTASRFDAAKKQYAIDAAKGGKGDPAKLNGVLPEFNFKTIGVGDAVDFLRDVTGANIFVNWRALEVAGVTKKTPITVRVRQMPLHECLRAILDETKAKQPLDFNLDKDNIIIVSTADDVPKT